MRPSYEMEKLLRRWRRDKLEKERNKWKKPTEVKTENLLHPALLPPRRLASKTGRR